jgi:hypothetical protein
MIITICVRLRQKNDCRLPTSPPSSSSREIPFQGYSFSPCFDYFVLLNVNQMKSIFLSICLSALVATCFSQTVKISECVIEKGELKKVEVDYNTATGDRTITVNGAVKKFYDLYPQEGAEYAARSGWYINSENIALNGASFVKYGLPRVLTPFEISKTAAYKGIGVYTESGLTAQELKEVEVIYIPVRSGCEFQPYQRQLPPCATVTVKANKELFKTGDTVIITASVAGVDAGTATYEWYVEPAKILGKADGNKITVSTEGLTTNLVALLTVRVAGKRCEPAHENAIVKINK